MGDSNYKPGQMDITDQRKTFDAFVKWSVRVAIISIAIVVFLAVFAS